MKCKGCGQPTFGPRCRLYPGCAKKRELDLDEESIHYAERLMASLGLTAADMMPEPQAAALNTLRLSYAAWEDSLTLEALENAIKAMRAYHALYGEEDR